jgi:hypothetical protein
LSLNTFFQSVLGTPGASLRKAKGRRLQVFAKQNTF